MNFVPAICLFWFGLFLFAASAVTAVARELRPEQTIIVDAKLLHPTINRSDDSIYWLNLSEGKLQRASLIKNQIDPLSTVVGKGAHDFCLSRDGRTAYIVDAPNGYSSDRSMGDQGSIQVVDLQTMVVTQMIPVPFDPYSAVCDSAGNLYVSDGSGQHGGNLRQVDPRTGAVLWESKWSISEQSTLRLTGDGRHLYFADESAMYGVKVSSDHNDLPSASDRSHHNAHPSGGVFELTSDDNYAVNREGNVFRLAEYNRESMPYVASLERNLAVACDSTGGRLWLLASADGGLVTYSYPEFKVMKTEYFSNPGDSFAYDAIRQRLWVTRWKEKCEMGGLDIYAVGNIPRVSDYPIRNQDRADNRSYSPTQDVVVRILFGASVLMFFATVFWRWLAWPLPTSILIIGWMGWIQAWLLFASLWQVNESTDFETNFAVRFMALLGTASGGLGWGILRGNKLCYVLYALLLIAALSGNIFHSRVLTVGGIGLLLAMLYCGRKHWNDLA